ncbi:unnamed protein product [Sphagnum troendelagicum]
MEYYAPAKGAPSSFVGLEGGSGSDSTGVPAVLGSIPYDDWHVKHGVPSPGSTAADTGVEEAVWQMTIQSQEGSGMDAAAGGQPGQFPERLGEPDCVYYMRTGLCGFGQTCRFNHPPNRKLATAIAQGKGDYPERFGQPECQYYLKTGTCKFGATCKYHHPRDQAGSTGRVQLNVVGLPLRMDEKECAYYMRTGSCKYGVTCKFHHPQPTTFLSPVYSTTGAPTSPAPQLYPQGVPSWPIARAPYLHPRLQGPSSYSPVVLPPHQGVVSVPGWNTYQGPVGSISLSEAQQHPVGTSYVYGALQQPDSGSGHGTYAPYLHGSSAMGLPATQPHNINGQRDTIFPERPGQPECQYYMKTGDCKFGITCRYHHPKDRAIPSPTCVLSPIGLPLRPGAPPCTFYTHYGICKFGPTCKFDHPLGGLTYSPSASSLADMPVAPYPTGFSPTAVGASSSIEAPHDGPYGASSSNDPAAPSEELPGLQQLRNGTDPPAVGASAGATTTQDLSTQVTIPRTGSGEHSQA